MKKAIFVNPSWDRYVSRRGTRYNRHWPPLDLLNCAAILEEHGFRCVVYNQRIEDQCEVQVEDEDIVFVTSSTLDRWQCPNLDLELFAHRITPFPEDRTYVLGAHGTMDPTYVAKTLGKAGLIREEPEMAVLQIALGEDKQAISGLTYLDKGQVVSNPVKTPLPLDQLAAPAYHQIDISRYGYELLGSDFALLETSRGCPHSCSYCYLQVCPNTA